MLQIKNGSADIASKHHSKALKDDNGEAISVCWMGPRREAHPIRAGVGGGCIYHIMINKWLKCAGKTYQ